MTTAKLILILIIALDIIVFIDIIIIHFNENRRERIKRIKEEQYAEEINNCIWDNGVCLFGKRKIDSHFINTIILYINSYTGEKRQKIIEMAERVGVVDHIYNKYKKSLFETDRKLYIYFLGEIRSSKKFKELLAIDVSIIEKQNIMFEYFFTISRIFNQMQYEKSESMSEIYADKMYEILEIVDKSYSYDIDKLCNFIIIEGALDYNFEENKILKNIFDKVINSEMSTKAKGEIVYACALRQIKGIKRYMNNKARELLSKSKRDREENEFLIKIVKAYGEFRIKQGEEILKKAANDKYWTVRAAAAKNIRDIKKNKDIFMKLVSDENWWVRNNAGENLIESGKDGEEILISILKCGDRFARETAAYRLSIGEFGIEILRGIYEGKVDKMLEKVELLINSGNNFNILDIILKDEIIKSKDKIKVIGVIKNSKFLEYYENSIKYRKQDEDVMNAASLKLEEIFIEAAMA